MRSTRFPMLISMLIVSVLALFATKAFATGTHTPEPPEVVPTSQEQAQAQNQGQDQSQGQGQYQGQGQEQSASSDQHQGQSQDANASSDQHQSQDANASNNGVKLVNTTTYKQVRQAPAVGAAAGLTTAKCQRGQEVRLSGPGAGIGLSRSKPDADCWLDELSDKELERGNETASIRLRCRISYYVDALGKDCEALLKTFIGAKPRTQAQIDADTARFKQSVTK